MMGCTGYKTKKELKLAVGKSLRYVETSMFGAEMPANGTGTVTVVGPDAYRDRRFYATVTVANFVIKAVK